MRRRVLAWALFAASSLVFAYAGCADDEDAVVQSGPTADASLDVARVDSASDDATGGEDASTEDAPAGDAGTDAPGDAADASSDASDAALDASQEASTDAGSVLFAHMGLLGAGPGKLVRIDTATGLVTVVGNSGQNDVRLAWDPSTNTMRAIVDALSAPRLATVDLCTGAITAGPRITRRLDGGADGGAIIHAECIAKHPNGTMYGGLDWNGDAVNVYLSESLVSYDVDGSTATKIGGTMQTEQDDCDSMTVVGDDLYVLDVASPTSAGIFRVNVADAGATRVGSVPISFVRIGYDPLQSTLFVVDSNNRKLYRLDVADAGATLAADLVTDAAAAELIDSIAAAPPPICP